MLQAAFSLDSHMKRSAHVQSDIIFEVFSPTHPLICPLECVHIQNCYSSSRSSSSGTWQAAAPHYWQFPSSSSRSSRSSSSSSSSGTWQAAAPHWWQFPSSCSSEQTKCDRQANRPEKESSEQKYKSQKLLSEKEKIISTANNAMSLREYAVRA